MVNSTDSTTERAVKTVAAGAAGAILGHGAIAATGMTAAGMIGGGTGIGAAAGPVGAALGAITGVWLLTAFIACLPARTRLARHPNNSARSKTSRTPMKKAFCPMQIWNESYKPSSAT